LHAAGAGDTATWMFANLDPTAYYDVYVTWSPEADASTTADYSVNDGGGAMDPVGQSGVAPVNQTQAPYDVQAAGVSWQDLGVFQAGSGALNVQLAANASSPVLANAVMILPYDTVPLTNLTMGSFTVDSQGNLSVSYTINGEDSPPFNIGIYGSPDGRQATTLLQTYPITDPTLLTGGGQAHTATFPASLDSLSSSQYVIAQLDSGDAVEETSKADNISAPLSGIFEQGDGTLVVLGNASSLTNDNIALTQDPVSGNVTVSTADAEGDPLTSGTFSAVTSVIVSTPGGNNTVSVDPSVTVPVSGYAGSGSSVTGTFAATDATPSVTIVDFEPTIDKGGIATLTANVGNLGGLGFTVTIDWGYYEGSDTIVYPAGTTSFTMTHHYVDDGAALFAIDFPVTVNVISTDGETASAATSTMGQDVLPAINIAGGTGSIMAGTAEDLSAVVADPGEFGTFTYEWTATGGGDSFSSTSAIFDFTPTNNADHTISLDVIDPDGKTVNEMLTIPGYVWPSGGGSITPFVPDAPSVSIEQCNADGTTPASAVQAGSNAYFKITVGTDSTPLQGTVTVYCNTENGPSIDGSQVAYANTDYIATGGQLTFTYATGYAAQIISVPTVVTSNGGTFSVDVPCISDSDADIPDDVNASVNCTIAGPAYELKVNVGNVTNVTDNSANPDSVLIGQSLSLTVVGAPANATITWEKPINPYDPAHFVGSFSTDANDGGPKLAQPTEFPPGSGAPKNTDCDGAWVQAGDRQTVAVIVAVPGKPAVKLTGYFNVSAPTGFSVTLTPFSGGIGDPDKGVTIQPYGKGKFIEFGANPPFFFSDSPQTPSGVIWRANGGDLSNWRYGWFQTAQLTIVRTNLNSDGMILSAGATKVDQNGLDGTAPQKANGTFGDNPGGALGPGHGLFYQIYATTWLMVELGAAGVWVPVDSINWDWSVYAAYPAGANTSVEIVGTTHDPKVLAKFTPTHVFPVWTSTIDENKAVPLP
jgi:hypothetical protein